MHFFFVCVCGVLLWVPSAGIYVLYTICCFHWQHSLPVVFLLLSARQRKTSTTIFHRRCCYGCSFYSNVIYFNYNRCNIYSLRHIEYLSPYVLCARSHFLVSSRLNGLKMRHNVNTAEELQQQQKTHKNFIDCVYWLWLWYADFYVPFCLYFIRNAPAFLYVPFDLCTPYTFTHCLVVLARSVTLSAFTPCTSRNEIQSSFTERRKMFTIANFNV